MGRLPKALALLLLVTVAAATVSGQVLATSAAPQGSLGGCHEQLPPAPAPIPANYKCCVAGHGLAIVQVPPDLRPMQLYAVAVSRFNAALGPIAGDDCLRMPLPLTGDPPGLTPLRI
ncbi:MAG TPA: hypothetical protein VMT28_03400 [Terriglobales bacterium]|jgi:hypothetical protein|nr:hypothetical protein [Terriglobales bacterium]